MSERLFPFMRCDRDLFCMEEVECSLSHAVHTCFL